MPQMNLEQFKKNIKTIWENQVEMDDVAIPVGTGVQLYSKATMLKILKAAERPINPLKVKKIVSVNATGRLVIDSGITNNIFISEEVLSQAEKELFQKDQLLFVEDETDNNKVSVYKIQFDEGEGEVRPEIGLVGNVSLADFNALFVNSGFFKEEVESLATEKISAFLSNPNVQELVWEKIYFQQNSYWNNKKGIVSELKTNLHLSDNNIEDDYYIYFEGNKVIIEGIKNPSYKKEVQVTYNPFENDIFYFSKTIGQHPWVVHKITSTVDTGYIYNDIKYQAEKFNDIADENFVNYLKTLDAFVDPKIIKQTGFNMSLDNNGLVNYFQTEQLKIENSVITFFSKQPATIYQYGSLQDNTSATIRRLLRKEIKEGLYSLEIENGKIKIKDIKSDSENVVFEQELSQNKKTEWNDRTDNDKYQKMYFTKHPNNGDLVKKWIINDNPHQLQCIGAVKLSDLRTYFVNDNLFYNPNQCNGIYLGENGTQVTALAAQQAPTVPKLPPASVNNVINLKWNNSMELWDLNVTTTKSTLDKKIKFAESENQILNGLVAKNNNANTVILFNKNDRKFLRAYYFDENNKKINCSNKLTNVEKENLSLINQKAKKRIKEPRTVNPKYYVNANTFSKHTKTFNLTIINRKWYVLCEDEIGMQVKAEIPLTPEEISVLSNLVKGAIDIKVTFDMEDKFKEIKYIDFTKKEDITINAKNLPNNSANGINIDTSKLMSKLIATISVKKNLKPEDDGITWKPWNSNTVAAVNETIPTNTAPQSPQQNQI